MFNKTLQYLLERDGKMTLGGYVVSDVSTETASVAGATVTKQEVESLLDEMEKADPPFTITQLGLNEGGGFVSFLASSPREGWLAPESNGHWNWATKKGAFCLRRSHAAKLRDYLSEQLAKPSL